jgi:adenylate cyclase
MCSTALRRYDDAIRYFEKAAAVVESEFTAASFAPQCYEAKGDLPGMREAAKRALARIEKVVAAEPDHGRALGYGAGLLASLGEVDRAKEWIERGTLVDPENTILHFNFVCALSRLREIDAALELLSNVIDKASKGWLVWLDNDTDLDPLRDHARFKQIVSDAKARFALQEAAGSDA